MDKFKPQTLAVILAALACTGARAQADPPRAIVAVVGEAERLTVGQDGFCGARTEIATPANVQFKVAPNRRTFFFIQTSFRVQAGTYTCRGDFSFVPEAGRLHIIRHTMQDTACRVELFKAVPGADPLPAELSLEGGTPCALASEPPRP